MKDHTLLKRAKPWHILPLAPVMLIAACSGLHAPSDSPPSPPSTPPPVDAQPAPQPSAVRDPQLEQKLARAELRLMEKEAQVDELQARLDDARREVVRAMAKLQSQATRAEAASGIAEAEIALQSLRAGSASHGVEEVSKLMQLSTAEFDKQNYGGALYLANQAKRVAAAAQGQIASVERGTPRAGEEAFALPVQLQTTSRANVREGPGSAFGVVLTLPAGAALTGYSFADQWVRITDDKGRSGWIYQGLISRRP
jgi:Bacterial SH3 domain